MVGEILALVAVGALALFMGAVLVARFAYEGPCPRCGRAIRRGQVACSGCGCCHSGPAGV